MAVNDLITLRKGTASEWAGANPTLALGEPGYDSTNGILKIGDGITAWSGLSNHKHTSLNITDFNSSVSGLLPVKSIVAGSNITISSSSGAYTINSTGTSGSSTSVSNYGSNRILLSDNTSTGISAQSNLTFDGSSFLVNPVGSSTSFTVNSSGVSIGNNASIYSAGQTVISNGKFSFDGDAQFSQYVLRIQTSHSSWTSLQNNGSSGIFLKPNKTYSFCANIVGRCLSESQNAAYKLEGLLINDTDSPSIIGTPIKTTLGETDSSWDVRALISGVYLLIQVQGGAAQDINWVSSISLTEAGGYLANGYVQSFNAKFVGLIP
jgi:hypothetical protein